MVELDDEDQSDTRSERSGLGLVSVSPPRPKRLVWPPEARQSAVLHLASGRFEVEYGARIEGRPAQGALVEGLCYLRKVCLLSDLHVVATKGAKFQVHRLIMAAQSAALRQRIADVTELVLDFSAEAVEVLVRWSYGELTFDDYQPSSRLANAEVLRLAHDLGIIGLAELAAVTIAKGTSVLTVVDDVRLCEAYGLPALRLALVKALIADKASLDIVARDPATVEHPSLMRELLAGLAGDRA